MSAHGKRFGRIVDNAETLGAVTTHTFTVPDDCRWELYGIIVERDVSATLVVEMFNENDFRLGAIASMAAGTGALTILPISVGGEDYMITCLMPMKAGWYIKLTWGAQQGTPEVACLVEEWDV